MAPAGGNVEVQTSEQVAMPAVSEAAAAVAAPAPAPRIKPTEYVAYPDSMKKARPTEVVCYPTQPVQAAPAVAAAPVIAPVDLSSTGLIMIETDPNKAASIAPAPAPESREHAPRRRQRPREVYTIENSEPLQQVETRSSN